MSKDLEIFPHTNDNSHRTEEIRKYVEREILITEKESLSPVRQKVTSNNHKKGSTFNKVIIGVGLGIFTYLIAMGARATKIVNEEFNGEVTFGGGSGDLVTTFPDDAPTGADYFKEFVEQVTTFGKGK